MLNLKEENIMILGANSMLARHTYDVLKTQGCVDIDRVYHDETDLLNNRATLKRFKTTKPTIVFNFAGFNGGIAFNQLFPFSIFDKTIRMNLNIIHACVETKVKKLLNCLTSCAYPISEESLKEEEFLKGEPHPSVACHAYGKRTAFIGGLQANKQHRLHVIGVILNNCYGAYDSLDQQRTKVGMALIMKFMNAKIKHEKEVIVWGTGQVKRELCYATNGAIGLVKAMELYNDINLPLNIGTGQDYTIQELAEKISKIVGYEGKIVYDLSKPDGQKRKILDITRMKSLLNWEPSISLEEGLTKTVEWYEEVVEENGKESNR